MGEPSHLFGVGMQGGLPVHNLFHLATHLATGGLAADAW